MLYKKTFNTILGNITAIEEENKIIALEIGENKYKNNAILKDTKLLKETKSQIEEYLEGKRKTFNLPLKPKGTDFQQRVWKELQKIPCIQEH